VVVVMPRLAKNARVVQHQTAGPYRLFIDGEEFPWHTVGGVRVGVTKDGITTVTVNIALDGDIQCVIESADDGAMG
jgi:hypothetical protein